MLLLAMFAMLSTYAQKAKGNPDSISKSATLQMKYVCEMHPQYVSAVPAKCPVCNNDMMQLSKKEQMKAEVVKLYTCPMDKDVFSTKGGKCPKCAMDMVELQPKSKSKKD